MHGGRCLAGWWSQQRRACGGHCMPCWAACKPRLNAPRAHSFVMMVCVRGPHMCSTVASRCGTAHRQGGPGRGWGSCGGGVALRKQRRRQRGPCRRSARARADRRQAEGWHVQQSCTAPRRMRSRWGARCRCVTTPAGGSRQPHSLWCQRAGSSGSSPASLEYTSSGRAPHPPAQSTRSRRRG